MNEGEGQRIVDSVAAATRKIGQVSSEQLDQGWQRLEGGLSRARNPSGRTVPTSSRLKWGLRGIAFAAAGAALVVAAHRLWPARNEAPLQYVLEGASAGPGAVIAAGQTPARLVFSDSSDVAIAPAAVLAVLAVDAHGSRVALANGALEVRVQHRAGSSWQFDAGPFTVKVRGTQFHLAFDAEAGKLAVQMRTGVVEVRGPSEDRSVTLRSGESLELFARSAGTAVVPPLSSALPEKPSAEPAKPVVDVEPAEAPSAGREPGRSAVHRRAGQVERAAAVAPAETAPSWATLIAQGEFAVVVREAEGRGIDATLASASAADLTYLADAARYTRRNDLARQALLGLRARFPGTARASDAAFFLGRLAEQLQSSSGVAVAWYDTYLNESAHGPYAGEALGREIALLARTDRARAQAAAKTYLERFPRGTQTELAKTLLESAP